MPMKVTTEGMEELTAMLREMGDRAQGAAAKGLYEGARVIADAVGKAARGVATKPFKYAKGGEKRDPSPEEKALLNAANAYGIAKFRKKGTEVETIVGYNPDGYASIPWNHSRTNTRTKYKMDESGKATWAGKQWTTGQGKGDMSVKPIPVIANAINSGTSFMRKQPFYRKAVSQNTQKAIEAIEKTVESEMEQIARENGG